MITQNNQEPRQSDQLNHQLIRLAHQGLLQGLLTAMTLERNIM